MRTVVRVLSGVALLMVAALLAGCRVDAQLDVAVEPDGSGTVGVDVAFDTEATEALGGVDDRLFLGDLEAAGWEIDGPDVEADGSTTIRATKSFVGEAELQRALDQVAGEGVFTDVRIGVDESFAERRSSVSFDVDLRDGWTLLSDPDVTAALGGEPFGVPVDQLTDGRSFDEIVDVSITTSVRAHPDEAPVASAAAPRSDDATTTLVVAEASVERPTALLLRWIAYALASLFALSLVLAVTGLWLQRRSDRLRPAPRPAKLASRIPGATPTSASSVASARARINDDDGPVRLVVVEPLSVLYDPAGTVENLLLAFVRDQGGDARADIVVDAHDEVVRGRSTAAAFWEATGIAASADRLDAEFVAHRRLRKVTPAFLKQLERRRIPIAAVSNDLGEWAEAARSRDRLTAVWPWLVSSEIGTAKPDPGMFERLRRETGVAYGHCVYIDTDIANLDAARDLGMRTAFYNADDLDLPDVVGHVVVTDLLALFRPR